MFVDKITLQAKAGNGGNGIVAFRREKYVPLGGPSGGDGGQGGSVIFEVDTNKSTLLDLRYQHHLNAQNGFNGRTKKMHGADGEDYIVQVPLGTLLLKNSEKRRSHRRFSRNWPTRHCRPRRKRRAGKLSLHHLKKQRPSDYAEFPVKVAKNSPSQSNSESSPMLDS